MIIVIKKDGAKEPFNPEKIKKAVRSAAVQAGFPEEEVNKEIGKALAAVMQSVSTKEEISTTEIRGIVLGAISGVVKAAWETYEQQK
ncbi:MAG: ATP cone domain-containing protein [Patescibacteria group bacterium]